MISWIKIFQMQMIDEKILNKRKEFDSAFSERSEKDRLKELSAILKKIKKEFKELNFDKTPSVETEKIKYADNQKEIVERAEKLSQISLYHHTLNVEKVIDQEMEIKNINDYIILKLLALLHDAGKSKLLRQKYNLPDNISHEEASFLYATKILEHTSFNYVPIYLKKDTYHLKFLQNADKIAREKELKTLLDRR